MTAARKRELVDQEARYRVYAMTNGFAGAFQQAGEDYKSWSPALKGVITSTQQDEGCLSIY
jgi:hypothetical protein